MEDLKQIQEFFSKPLNENVYVEAFKLEKALKGMGHDVKVKYLDDFGKDVFEIYSKKPLEDDSIFYDAEKLGYSNVRVFDHSNESVNEGTFTDGEIAIYDDPKGDAGETKIYKRGNGYYGVNDSFDFEAKNRVDLEQKLKSYGYELLAGSLDEATKEEETEFHTKLDKLIHDTFGKRKGEMEEYNTGIYYDPAKDTARPKAKEASKSALEKVKDMIQKIIKEEEGYSKYLKDDPEYPEGKTKGLDTATMNKILMNVIKDLDELKQLGEGVIEEELCAKGKAYIKKRQAAGEKSSAYLSGRAVKVCKGQMKG